MERPDGGDRSEENSSPDGSDHDPGETERDTRPNDGPDEELTAEVDESPTGENNRGLTGENDGLLQRFLNGDEGAVVFARDLLVSVAIVAVIALLLFGVSGIWPPLVAVESGSMEPNMERGDLIFVVNEERFVGDDPIGETGIVTHEAGVENGEERFGEPGDVIIFRPGGSEAATPVIHRAHYWVEEGDNWVEEANPEYVNGATCDELASCPAPHDGFITKGDNNAGYDQAGFGGTNTGEVVKTEWIEGKALFRIPYLGYVRLTFDSLLWADVGTPMGLDAGPEVALSNPAGSMLATPAGVAGGLSVAVSGVSVGATVVGRRRLRRKR